MMNGIFQTMIRGVKDIDSGRFGIYESIGGLRFPLSLLDHRK